MQEVHIPTSDSDRLRGVDLDIKLHPDEQAALSLKAYSKVVLRVAHRLRGVDLDIKLHPDEQEALSLEAYSKVVLAHHTPALPVKNQHHHPQKRTRLYLYKADVRRYWLFVGRLRRDRMRYYAEGADADTAAAVDVNWLPSRGERVEYYC